MFKKNLSPQSKIWVYQSTRKFTEQESRDLAGRINGFVKEWTAHKLEVQGEGLLLFNRFVVLAADEQNVQVSGCSIDSSVHFIRTLEKDFDTNFFDRWSIAYQVGDKVESCSVQEFEKLVSDGVVNDETIVFNNLVSTLEQFDKEWKVALKDSWVKKLPTSSSVFKFSL